MADPHSVRLPRAPGLDPAPRIVGGVAAPSGEPAAGVPADLDLIARLTLREGAGPTTPGDLANQIAVARAAGRPGPLPAPETPLRDVSADGDPHRPAPGPRSDRRFGLG